MKAAIAVTVLLLGCAAAPEPQRAPPASSSPPPPASVESPPPAPTATAAATASAVTDAPPPASARPKQTGVCSVPVFLAEECAGVEGVYQVEGWVVDARRCPPCPRGATCKPCQGESIVLSSQRNPSDRSVPAGGNVLVRGKATAQLQVGQHVTVKVRFDHIAFLGDPCCIPGPYFVDLVP